MYFMYYIKYMSNHLLNSFSYSFYFNEAYEPRTESKQRVNYTLVFAIHSQLMKLFFNAEKNFLNAIS